MRDPNENYHEHISINLTKPRIEDNLFNNSSSNFNSNSIDIEDSSISRDRTEDKVIGRKETRDVTRLKLIILSILVASAIAVGVTTFQFVRHSEISKFHENFNDDTYKVMQTIGASVENIFASFDLLSTTMVSHAISSNQSWPFVTIPHFGNKVSKIFSINAGLALCSVMIVESDQRTDWEDYAWANRGMVNESLRILSTDKNYRGPIPWDVPINRSIHSNNDIVPYNESYV
jgi:hypothetical protein